MVTFSIGELFTSFNDIQQKLAEYSEAHYCHFYIKDSKKLMPDEVINDQLIYKHIVYSCIYGGQKPRFRGSGTRSVSSIRHGCPANVYLRVTKSREHLQVRSFVEQHNHEITEELFRAAAQDKKLPLDLKIEVEELLLLGVEKDRICDYIRYVSKKTLDKKNLFNIYDAAVKQPREITTDRALMLLQKVYAIDTPEEAETILNHLLATGKPTRRSRKQEDLDSMANFEVTYVNEENDSSPEEVVEESVEDLTMDQRIERLMSTFSSDIGDDQIVIVQEGEPIQVVEGGTEGEEYLAGDGTDTEGGERIVIKQEGDVEIAGKVKEDASGARYLTLKELSRTYQNRKRKLVKSSPVQRKKLSLGSTSNEETVVYVPNKKRIIPVPDPVKKCKAEQVGKRIYTQAGYEVHEEQQQQQEEYASLKMEMVRAEHDKLVTETEMLKLKRNKIVKDISKLDVEKSKLYLEIELIKEQKKSAQLAHLCLEHKFQLRELKTEKLRLEVAKLKIELNEN